ncbi:MAG: major capsid protein [Treponemataceae bacterium]|nr:major capsid protein [Treponemataceae bacterium]
MVIVKAEDIVRVIGALPAETSNARGYFKRTVNKNTTQLAVADIKSTVGNIPVIKRGGSGFRPVMKADVEYIVPQPIEIDDSFSPIEDDAFERATGLGKQQIVDERLSRWAKVVRETTRALCCQAHRGSIDYMMQAGSKLVRYQVDYGNVAGIEEDSQISALTVGSLVEHLEELSEKISNNGIGGDYEFIAASDVYRKVVELSANQTKFNVATGKGFIDFGGFRIMRDNDSYTDTDEGGKETVKRLLEPHELMIRASDAGQELDFLRLDDSVQRQAVPLYSFTVERPDHRGTDLYVKSKPFPLINTKGIAVLKFAG